MVKQGKQKTSKRPAVKKPENLVEPRADVPEVKPDFWTYVRATLQLMWGWARAHKFRALAGLLVIVIGVAGLVWVLRPSATPLTNDQIVWRVSRELGISGDANPAILTVENKDETTQPFLDEAENGDKVILYYKAGKSVLFRPRESRVVRAGTFVPPKAKVFIRQGGEDDAKMQAVKQQVASVSEVELVSEDYSTNRLNEKTIVVSLTDRYPGEAQKIAEKLQAQVVRLPSGETIPDADILVIIGMD